MLLAWLISQANTLADLRGWTPFTGLQVEYSLLERTAECDLYLWLMLWILE
jgi:aryl-alcohol dehydrogenase-like predicted oxidoreductase